MESGRGSARLSPTAEFASIRTLLALTAQMDYEIHQIDVIGAYLNGTVDEEVYIQQLPGTTTEEMKGMVC